MGKVGSPNGSAGIGKYQMTSIVKTRINIQERKPVWIALADLYLDAELQDSDLVYIARTIKESPYDLDEAWRINKYEVFPVLQENLQEVAGEWAGFDENWLVDRITRSLSRQDRWEKLRIEVSYHFYKGMQQDYWERLEEIYLSMEGPL